MALTSKAGTHTVVWDTKSWKPLATVNGIFADFSRDDRFLLTQTLDDHVAHVWEARTGEPLLGIPAVGGITGAAFSRDAKSIIAVGEDGNVRAFPCSVCRSIAEIQDIGERRVASSASR